MYLKFICSEEFDSAEEIGTTIQEYLPNLIHDREIIRTEAFRGIFDTRSILPMIEGMAEPDWDKDIVVVVIYGSLYFADIELFEAVGRTLDYLPLKRDGRAQPFSEMPKLGAQLLPNNMSEEPRGDVGYWAKLGVEEILHYFIIPEQHDENCFFHPKECGKATVEDCWKDYCPKCREFMRQIKDPVDFGVLFAKMQEIYEIQAKRRGWKEVLRNCYNAAKRYKIFGSVENKRPNYLMSNSISPPLVGGD